MSQSKQKFALGKINELVDKVLSRESTTLTSQSYSELEWIKFYAKDLASKCEGCEEAPHGHETKKES